MGRKIYISEKDIEIFDLLESIFDWNVQSGAEYSEEQCDAVQKLYDKMHGIKSE